MIVDPSFITAYIWFRVYPKVYPVIPRDWIGRKVLEKNMAGRAGRRVGKLTVASIEKLTKPGLYGDGGNLYLKIGDSGSRSWSWVVRFKIDGRSRKLGLGPLSLIDLATAREKAVDACRLLLSGRDPIEVKHAADTAAKLADANSQTFDQCAAAYIEAHRAGWKNAKHAAQWAATIKTYASPYFGALPVKDIDTAMVMRALRPIWVAKTETATRVGGRIKKIMGWAEALGYRPEGSKNPAQWRDHLDQLLPARGKVSKVRHHAALPYDELPPFMVALQAQYGTAALAMEFAILTAARTGEVIGATWPEIDLVNKVWIVPEERMKGGREHRVPLSARVIEILEDVKSIRQGGDFIFPGLKRGKPMSDMALLMTLRRMDRDDLTTHGFRSTFRDWVSEQTSFSGEVAEMALAHAIKGKTEAAYRRGDLFDKRRDLMNIWASYCLSPPATDNVIPIKAGRLSA